ncbi:MAG: di-trans,poly-cis-decaprenylcistransferase [Candidatus Eisenbacteria bacterium]|uniref:Isoprenyl transferase n=1 Tax=Eiseniibacteriota bacterium TaxID=2212470 RepID=A0A937XB73_UNCEI|nr:di-trans,poly-cis-decaprenylcistransferase [Candidatus Eisenbacteria bacterium]
MGAARDPAPPERLPRHIVLIPDGNGRWAAERGKPTPEGHLAGARAVEAFLRVCRDWGVRVATVWAFSTENWERSGGEVDAIMNLIALYLRRNRGRFEREDIRLRHIGRRDRIAHRYPRLDGLMARIEGETRGHDRFALNLALDYGGRDEALRAVGRLLARGCPPEELTWERLSDCLDTAGQPDPDLVIRTSGELRLSGILPLQAAYAELVFPPRLLPEMREEDFREAIREFARRERRFGGRPGAAPEPGSE